MNQLVIAGHLGTDPEVRFTSSGRKVTSLRVATRARKGGKDETIWWRVSVWGDQFDKMMPYFKKGSPIVVTGELEKPEIFNDKEGRPQVSMNITASNLAFSPFGKPESSSQEGGTANAHFGGSQFGGSSFPGMGDSLAQGQGKDVPFDDEEIPF